MSDPPGDRSRIRQRIVSNTAHGFLGRILGLLVTLILLPWILGRLGDEQYAIYALAASVTGYIALLDLGIGTGYVRFVAEAAARDDPDAMNEVLSTGFFAYLGFGAGIMAAWLILGDRVLSLLNLVSAVREQAHATFTIAILVLALSGAAAAFRAVLYGLQRIDVAVRVGICLILPRVGLIVLALVCGLGPVGLILVDLVTFLIGSVAMAFTALTIFPALELRPHHASRTMFKRMFRYGVRLQVSRLSEVINFHLDKLLLSRFVGLPSVTHYELGGRLSQTARSFPLMMLDALVPAISERDASGDRETVLRMTERALRYLLLASLPMFAFLALESDHVLELWLGIPRPEAAMVVRALAAGFLFNVASGAFTTTSQGIDRTDYQMRVALVALGVNLVSSLLLVQRFGLRGVVVGTAGALVAAYVYAHLTFDRLFAAGGAAGAARRPGRWRVFILPTLATLLASLATTGLHHVVPWPDWRLPQTAVVALVGFVFVVVYGASLYALGVVDATDRKIIGDLLGRRAR